MSHSLGGSQQLLKDINRMALVRRLCVRPGQSRVELAHAVGLTKSTVSVLIRELMAEGWIMARDVVATGDLGRRPTPLFIDPDRLMLLGAELGVDGVRVVACSLTGDVLARTVVPYGPGRSVHACLGTLVAALQSLHADLADTGRPTIGLGVGLPGGVDEQRGFVHFAPHLGWRNVPVGTLLTEALRGGSLECVPMFIKNEADAAALGELEFNPRVAADPLLYLSLNQGVGAGVIVGDRLLSGCRGFAGEVGHVVLQLGGPRCSCGRRGCAEALISARTLLGGEDDRPDAVAELQRRLASQHAPTLRAVEAAGTYLGVLLHNLVSAYDPACIVLGGEMVELGDALLKPAMRTLQEYAAVASFTPPPLRIARFRADAVAIGAAALARYRLTRPLVRGMYARIESTTERAA